MPHRAWWRSSPADPSLVLCSSFRSQGCLPRLQELTSHCHRAQTMPHAGSDATRKLYLGGRVSVVEPMGAAGQINHCLGTCVCADAGTSDCLSVFLEPELKFTGVINGLASTIKATSITHSAKEGPGASVSCLLFFSRWRRDILKRVRKKWPSHPAVPSGRRPWDAGFHTGASHGSYLHSCSLRPCFPLIHLLPAAPRELPEVQLYWGASLSQRPVIAPHYLQKKSHRPQVGLQSFPGTRPSVTIL